MSDNTDRVLEDLKEAIDDLPSPAISMVLEAWRRRMEQCDPATALVLNSCIKDIQAANLIDKGNPVKALEILLSDNAII